MSLTIKRQKFILKRLNKNVDLLEPKAANQWKKIARSLNQMSNRASRSGGEWRKAFLSWTKRIKTKYATDPCSITKTTHREFITICQNKGISLNIREKSSCVSKPAEKGNQSNVQQSAPQCENGFNTVQVAHSPPTDLCQPHMDHGSTHPHRIPSESTQPLFVGSTSRSSQNDASRAKSPIRPRRPGRIPARAEQKGRNPGRRLQTRKKISSSSHQVLSKKTLEEDGSKRSPANQRRKTSFSSVR
ncbi:hypothetical protein Trydic_g11840 [Trypoxylus dichotomus]